MTLQTRDSNILNKDDEKVRNKNISATEKYFICLDSYKVRYDTKNAYLTVVTERFEYCNGYMEI